VVESIGATQDAAQPLVAADTLIESFVVAGFGLWSFRQLSAASFHPRAAELGIVSPQGRQVRT